MVFLKVMDSLVRGFRGKIVILSEGGLSKWEQLVDALPASCGGDVWRNIYKLALRDNGDAMRLCSARSAFVEETKWRGKGAMDRDDVITAKRMALDCYLKSIRMGMEYERLKDESYSIPVIFAVGDDDTDAAAADMAVSAVFESHYRLTKFQLMRNVKGQLTSLSDNVLRESLIKCMKHPMLRSFLGDHDDTEFKKETWHRLFSGEMDYVHQLVKL